MIQTANQQRMQRAWERLSDDARFGPDSTQWQQRSVEAGEYMNALKRTASDIHNRGLVTALAFRLSRKRPWQGHAYRDLSYLTLDTAAHVQDADLLGYLRNADMAELIRLTEESLAYINMLCYLLGGAGIRASENPDEERIDG